MGDIERFARGQFSRVLALIAKGIVFGAFRFPQWRAVHLLYRAKMAEEESV